MVYVYIYIFMYICILSLYIYTYIHIFVWPPSEHVSTTSFTSFSPGLRFPSPHHGGRGLQHAVPHRVVSGDIGKPSALMAQLKRKEVGMDGLSESQVFFVPQDLDVFLSRVWYVNAPKIWHFWDFLRVWDGWSMPQNVGIC